MLVVNEKYLENVLDRPKSKKAVKKVRQFKALKHLKKIGVIVLNLIFGNNIVYWMIGFVNKNIFCGFLRSIFMLYPANQKYTKEYVYIWYAKSMKWRPRLVGIMLQNRKVGMIFGISATEEDMISDNGTNLRKVESRLEKIRLLVGAKQKTYAGVLPSIMNTRGIVSQSIEREITAKAVYQAIELVKNKENLNVDTPLIVIGGQGFIGSQLINSLSNNGFRGQIFSLDIKNGSSFVKVQDIIFGKPAIMLNVSKRGAIKNYIPHLWPGIVVLNEVYPEPSDDEVVAIGEKGSILYHINGVEAFAWPPFPRGYKGGIPCCASFLPKEGEGKYKVLVTKL